MRKFFSFTVVSNLAICTRETHSLDVEKFLFLFSFGYDSRQKRYSFCRKTGVIQQQDRLRVATQPRRVFEKEIGRCGERAPHVAVLCRTRAMSGSTQKEHHFAPLREGCPLEACGPTAAWRAG